MHTQQFNIQHYSPLLKKRCVRQVMLDKWFPMITTRNFGEKVKRRRFPFCARCVSPDRWLVQACLARAKKAVATIYKTYIYIYIYYNIIIYDYIYIYIYIYIYMCWYVPAALRRVACERQESLQTVAPSYFNVSCYYICMCIYIYIYIHIYLSIYLSLSLYICIYPCLVFRRRLATGPPVSGRRPYTAIYTHIYIYIYIHIHTQRAGRP